MPYGYGEANRQQKQREYDSFRQDTAGGQGERGTHGNRGRSGTTYYGTTGQEGKNFLNAVDRHYNRGDWGRTNQGADTTTYGTHPRYDVDAPQGGDGGYSQRFADNEAYQRSQGSGREERERQRRRAEQMERFRQEKLKQDKAGKISGAEAFGHDDLADKYVSAYQQRLSDAYDAAETGVGRSILEAGFATGDEYDALNTAKTGQEEWLKELGQGYQTQAKNEYDRWLNENTEAINALGTSAEVDAYDWTDANYDLDLTGGSGFESGGAYDADYIPEFYEGFKKEFSEDYSDPTMPDEWGGYKVEKKAPAATKVAPGDKGAPRRTVRKSNPVTARTGYNPSSGGSARYY